MGLEQNVDKLWQQAQALLRERQQWSVAMSMCFLKSIEGGLAILLVPASVKKRLVAHEQDLAVALGEVNGAPVRLILHETA
jgi:hypothetical protein